MKRIDVFYLRFGFIFHQVSVSFSKKSKRKSENSDFRRYFSHDYLENDENGCKKREFFTSQRPPGDRSERR